MTLRFQITLGAVISMLFVFLILFSLTSGISQILDAGFQTRPSERSGTDDERGLPQSSLPADALVERHSFAVREQSFAGKSGIKSPILNVNPLDVATCEHLTVMIVSDFDDKNLSRVTLRMDNDSSQRTARIGDVIGKGTLVGIAQHPRTLSPTVWFMEDQLCQAELFRSASRTSGKKDSQKSASQHQLSKKQSTFASHVKRRSVNEFEVDRAAVEEILVDPSRFMSGVQAIPQKRGDEIAGLSLRRLSSASPLSALGLKSGDLLTRLNGFPLADPEKMLTAYASLRTAEHLRVEIERGSERLTIDAWIH